MPVAHGCRALDGCRDLMGRGMVGAEGAQADGGHARAGVEGAIRNARRVNSVVGDSPDWHTDGSDSTVTCGRMDVTGQPPAADTEIWFFARGRKKTYMAADGRR